VGVERYVSGVRRTTVLSLLELVTDHRKLIERRAGELFVAVAGPKAIPRNDDGIPILIDQLVDTLRREDRAPEDQVARGATQYGGLLFARGFTVGEVVRVYGTIREAVTKVGQELGTSISNRELEILNRMLDMATSAAVTEYQRQRVNAAADEGLEHIGALAHELRNALSSAVMAFSVIKQGVVGKRGDTLDRSLKRMGDLLDRAMAEVRLRKDAVPIMEPLRVARVLDEIAAMVYSDTAARRQSLDIEVDPDLEIVTDRQFFTSAVSNLVQNGLKYTPNQGHIHVRARGVDHRLVIEVEDECGGLPASVVNALFVPFARGTTRSPGTGLGLSIVARAAKTLGGDVYARNLPGKGCVFTLEFPRLPTATAAA
jgi:signal transduction histidine kinase